MSDRRLRSDEFTNLTMRDIEDLDSAILEGESKRSNVRKFPRKKMGQ
jgi:hypothetical protein